MALNLPNEVEFRCIQIYHFNFSSDLDGGESCDNGRRAKAVRDEREMSQRSLDPRLQDGLRTCVAQRGPVLVQQIHNFFQNNPILKKEMLCVIKIMNPVCLDLAKVHNI